MCYCLFYLFQMFVYKSIIINSCRNNFVDFFPDKPQFVYSAEHIQFGRFNFPINISVSVYCYPAFNSWNVSSKDYCCYNETNFGHITDSNVTVRSIDGVIQVKGLKMSLTKLMIKEEHFTTYTFWIKNEIGYSSFKVKLISSGKSPKNISYSLLKRFKGTKKTEPPTPEI